MNSENMFSNREDLELAAKTSAFIGMGSSLAGIVLSVITIVRKKRGENVSKGLKAANWIFTVFAVAGALFGTLLTDKALNDEED